jgi:hypothetical protein
MYRYLPNAHLLSHRTPLHATIWNFNHMLYDYRYVMGTRCPSLPATVTPLMSLYTTGVLIDPPLFTRGVEILPYTLLV